MLFEINSIFLIVTVFLSFFYFSYECITNTTIMAKRSIQGGGILGSGIFGLFGTTIKCDSTDDSMYCNIMKLFNLFMVVLIVAYILYIAYNVFPIPSFHKRRWRIPYLKSQSHSSFISRTHLGETHCILPCALPPVWDGMNAMFWPYQCCLFATRTIWQTSIGVYAADFLSYCVFQFSFYVVNASWIYQFAPPW